MKKEYVIRIEGCDASTFFRTQMTEVEAEAFIGLCLESQKASTYACMPVLKIYLYSDYRVRYEDETEREYLERGYDEEKELSKAAAVRKTGTSILVEPDIHAMPEIGSIISFGGYDWRVLDIQDGKALLLSGKIVERRAYNQSNTDITWVECDLRCYLNGEFYDSLGEEKARIAEIKVKTNDNLWYGTDGGVKTTDKVFLLSLEEVVKYFGDSGQLKNRPDGAWYIDDEYSSARIVTDKNGEALWWWLRSPGDGSYSVAGVGPDGYICVYGSSSIAWSDGGVRPAMWLNL